MLDVCMCMRMCTCTYHIPTSDGETNLTKPCCIYQKSKKERP